MKMAWQGMRAGRWLLWAGFFAYCVHDLLDRASHVDHFGQLFLSTEIRPVRLVHVGRERGLA